MRFRPGTICASASNSMPREFTSPSCAWRPRLRRIGRERILPRQVVERHGHQQGPRRLILHADFMLLCRRRFERLYRNIRARSRQERFRIAVVRSHPGIEHIGDGASLGEGACPWCRWSCWPAMRRCSARTTSYRAAQREDPVLDLHLVLHIDAELIDGLVRRVGTKSVVGMRRWSGCRPD